MVAVVKKLREYIPTPTRKELVVQQPPVETGKTRQEALEKEIAKRVKRQNQNRMRGALKWNIDYESAAIQFFGGLRDRLVAGDIEGVIVFLSDRVSTAERRVTVLTAKYESLPKLRKCRDCTENTETTVPFNTLHAVCTRCMDVKGTHRGWVASHEPVEANKACSCCGAPAELRAVIVEKHALCAACAVKLQP